MHESNNTYHMEPYKLYYIQTVIDRNERLKVHLNVPACNIKLEKQKWILVIEIKAGTQLIYAVIKISI